MRPASSSMSYCSAEKDPSFVLTSDEYGLTFHRWALPSVRGSMPFLTT